MMNGLICQIDGHHSNLLCGIRETSSWVVQEIVPFFLGLLPRSLCSKGRLRCTCCESRLLNSRSRRLNSESTRRSRRIRWFYCEGGAIHCPPLEIAMTFPPCFNLCPSSAGAGGAPAGALNWEAED